jgi:hypothetical protein
MLRNRRKTGQAPKPDPTGKWTSLSQRKKRALALHPPEMGMHLVDKFSKDPDLTGSWGNGGMQYYVVAILKGTGEARDRIISKLTPASHVFHKQMCQAPHCLRSHQVSRGSFWHLWVFFRCPLHQLCAEREHLWVCHTNYSPHSACW